MSKEKEILKEVGESPQYRLFEFFLQEHGITLLEGQMHDIIHEVQLYLDATNDNPVVQQSLTTESMKCYICKKELKGYGYESPLDGERVCENCFSRDQYVNDNTDWDNSVVKENLTSEERAIEYANSVLPYANDVDAGYEQWMAWDNARLGYLSALKDSEKELTAYREALKEIVEMCDYLGIEKEQAFLEIRKAKQLLKEEEI